MSVKESREISVENVRTAIENTSQDFGCRDLALSVCATLLLAKNTNPTALIYVGGTQFKQDDSRRHVRRRRRGRWANKPSAHRLFYLSDSFTPAAFVSQAANRTTKDLAKVDLLRGSSQGPGHPRIGAGVSRQG